METLRVLIKSPASNQPGYVEMPSLTWNCRQRKKLIYLFRTLFSSRQEDCSDNVRFVCLEISNLDFNWLWPFEYFVGIWFCPHDCRTQPAFFSKEDRNLGSFSEINMFPQWPLLVGKDLVVEFVSCKIGNGLDYLFNFLNMLLTKALGLLTIFYMPLVYECWSIKLKNYLIIFKKRLQVEMQMEKSYYLFKVVFVGYWTLIVGKPASASYRVIGGSVPFRVFLNTGFKWWMKCLESVCNKKLPFGIVIYKILLPQ